jgi:hypothetical protein
VSPIEQRYCDARKRKSETLKACEDADYAHYVATQEYIEARRAYHRWLLRPASQK